MRLRGKTFSHEPRSASAYPAEVPVRVRTFGERFQPLDFTARVIGPSSESHLRIRTDDGLVFAVPAAKAPGSPREFTRLSSQPEPEARPELTEMFG